MTWWVLTLLHNSRAWTSLYTLASTNRQQHLFMAWANYHPARRHVYRNVRGTRVFCGYQYVWDTPNLVEQDESGDTYTHTFRVPTLQPTDHVWYYLFSFPGPYGNQCQGPLIHIHPPEIPMPSAKIFHSVNQSIPSHNTTILTFDSVLWDDYNFYNPANPERLTVPTPALYQIGCCFRFATTQPAGASASIRRNGIASLVKHSHYIDGNNWPGASFSLTTLMRLQQGDYVDVLVYHTSGPPRDIVAEPESQPHLWIARIGPYPV